jgi:hypothetical protein
VTAGEHSTELTHIGSAVTAAPDVACLLVTDLTGEDWSPMIILLARSEAMETSTANFLVLRILSSRSASYSAQPMLCAGLRLRLAGLFGCSLPAILYPDRFVEI